MDVVKGLKTYAWFQPDHLGTFNILCAEYCGQGHSEMNADLKVVAPEAFEAWLAKPETPAAAATATGPGPETRKLFDFSTFFRLQDKMTFRWKVDGPLLHCALQAPAEGWVAVGFNPSHGGMDGAKFVIAYVKDGKVYAQDHVGVSPVRHEAVEQHGGTSDVTNVFGALSNGVTEVCFSIPLQGTDGQQKVLDPSGSTILLLAYNAGMADFRTKHNYRKAFRVKLATGESSPLEAQRP
jgi:hypothetical protein